MALTKEQERLVTEAFPLVGIEARRPKSLPPGINADDLESALGESLIEAVAVWDPKAGGEWRKYARNWLRNKAREVMSSARKRANRHTTIEVHTPEGESYPRPDKRASDPAAVAAVRETVLSSGSPKLVGELQEKLPSPAEVAARVNVLRAAVFMSLDRDDVERAMRALAEKAGGGDMKAFAAMMQLLAPTNVVSANDIT